MNLFRLFQRNKPKRHIRRLSYSKWVVKPHRGYMGEGDFYVFAEDVRSLGQEIARLERIWRNGRT